MPNATRHGATFSSARARQRRIANVSRPGALIVLTGVALLATMAHAAGAGAPANVDRLGLGVVAIEARVGGDAVHGSGTVIDAENGLVLTSARAVWGATSLKLSTGVGIVYGRIVARAPCDELALVETQPRVPGLVSLADLTGPAPAPGSAVTAYGRRLVRPGTGMITLPARVASAPLKLDTPLVPEAAGGPILDTQGRLLGIAASSGGAIPWDAVKRRLDELKPGPQRVFVGWRDQYSCSSRLNRLTLAAHPAFKPQDARLVVPITPTRVK
jgi:S1-C subfamily serine protease